MRTYIRTGNKGEKVLSYDENFRKWQKSGESKTPGGVKIGIFRFIVVLLFFIPTSPLWAAGCDANTQQSDCDCNGWFFLTYGSTGSCTECEAGNYCENGTQTPCSQNTDSFPGSYNLNQCFKRLDGNTSDSILYNDLPKCENASGGDVNGCLYYPNIGSNGCVVCPTSSNEQISLMNKCTDSTNASNYTNQSTDYHIEEQRDDSVKCYSNTRNCNLFRTENTTVTGVVEGQALWDNSEEKWRVYITENPDYRCKKTETNKEIRTIIDGNGSCEVNCKATRVSWPRAGTMVSNATDDIVYAYIERYFCTSCIDDENMARVPTESTEFIGGAQQNCVINSHRYCVSNNAKSCRCKPVPRGYYKSSNNCSWNNDTDTLPNCTAACGPGQTTNEGGGATSEADCHYTTQTRFCDAHGCFFLSDLSWDATNSYTWGGATSPSPGQQ